MTVTLTAPGEGEEFPAGPVRFRILEDGVGVDKRFGVVESCLPPGSWGRRSTSIARTTKPSTS
jgi:hypothetical protein